MTQLLVRDEVGAVVDRIRATLAAAGFSVRSDQVDSVQIDPAGQLGERHSMVFERRPAGADASELLQVWVVESGVAECAVTMRPDGELTSAVLAKLGPKDRPTDLDP